MRREARGGRGAEQAEAERRDRREVAAAQREIVTRPSSEPASIPQPNALTSRANPYRRRPSWSEASTSSATLVAPATSMAAPDVRISDRTSGSRRTPSRLVGPGAPPPRPPLERGMAAQPGQEQRGGREGHRVEPEDEFGEAISSIAPATAGSISWPISRTAPNRPLAAVRRVGWTTDGAARRSRAQQACRIRRPAPRRSA